MVPLDFPTPPQKILIIKPSAVGDVVHALPVLNLIRRRWPASHISWLVTPACAALVEGHPQLDEVIYFDRKRLAHSWYHPASAMALAVFIGSLRRPKFDLVVDLQGLFRSGIIARTTGAPIRIGFHEAREMSWIFYTHGVPIHTAEQHAIDRYMKIAAALGCDTSRVEFHFAVGAADRQWVDQQIPPGIRFAVLLPGTNWLTKRWPIEYFAALVPMLKARLGLECVVAGGPDDVALAAQVPAKFNLAGKTDLRQIVALLQRADLVIANDSGPMHIAAALGRPLVAPYGPTNPIRTGPYGRMDSVIRIDIPCSPCYSRTCSHQSCMKWLMPESVMALAEAQCSK